MSLAASFGLDLVGFLERWGALATLQIAIVDLALVFGGFLGIR